MVDVAEINPVSYVQFPQKGIVPKGCCRDFDRIRGIQFLHLVQRGKPVTAVGADWGCWKGGVALSACGAEPGDGLGGVSSAPIRAVRQRHDSEEMGR